MKFLNNQEQNFKIMENKDKKLRLAQALEEEFERLKDHPNFDTEKHKKDHYLAIKYLTTGEHSKYYDDFDLLCSCIEDFEQMCLDYEIN